MCKANVIKAIKYLETNAKRNDFAKNCTTTFEYDGIAYCTDGYQILRSLENIDASMLKKASEKFKGSIEKFFDDNYLGMCDSYELPDVAKLESEIKNLKKGCKSKTRPLWQVRIGYAVTDEIFVNAEYLLNAVLATGEKTAYCAGKYKPLMFLGEDTQYALLPIGNAGKHTAGEFAIVH